MGAREIAFELVAVVDSVLGCCTDYNDDERQDER